LHRFEDTTSQSLGGIFGGSVPAKLALSRNNASNCFITKKGTSHGELLVDGNYYPATPAGLQIHHQSVNDKKELVTPLERPMFIISSHSIVSASYNL
jgi:hypothetical protein